MEARYKHDVYLTWTIYTGNYFNPTFLQYWMHFGIGESIDVFKENVMLESDWTTHIPYIRPEFTQFTCSYCFPAIRPGMKDDEENIAWYMLSKERIAKPYLAIYGDNFMVARNSRFRDNKEYFKPFGGTPRNQTIGMHVDVWYGNETYIGSRKYRYLYGQEQKEYERAGELLWLDLTGIDEKILHGETLHGLPNCIFSRLQGMTLIEYTRIKCILMHPNPWKSLRNIGDPFLKMLGIEVKEFRELIVQ